MENVCTYKISFVNYFKYYFKYLYGGDDSYYISCPKCQQKIKVSFKKTKLYSIVRFISVCVIFASCSPIISNFLFNIIPSRISVFIIQVAIWWFILTLLDFFVSLIFIQSQHISE